MPSLVRGVSGLVVLLLTNGCTERDAGVDATSSANSAHKLLPAPECEVQSRTVIGVAADLPGNDFIMPMAVAADDEGHVFIYDGRLVDLRRFDGAGEYLGTVARRGAGPGELTMPTTFALAGDTLRVWDGRAGRLATYSRDGHLLGDVATTLAPSRSGASSLLHAYAEGGYLVHWLAENRPSGGSGRGSESRSVYRTGVDGNRERILTITTPAQSLFLDGGQTRIPDLVPRSRAWMQYSATEDRLVVVAQRDAVTNGVSEFSLTSLSASTGAEMASVRYAVPARELRNSERDSLRARMLTAASVGGVLPIDRDRARTLDDVADWPAHWPPVRAVAQDGPYTWVGLGATSAADSLSDWIAFDAALKPALRVRLPTDLAYPFFHAGHAWGTRNLTGIPRVEGYVLSDSCRAEFSSNSPR